MMSGLAEALETSARIRQLLQQALSLVPNLRFDQMDEVTQRVQEVVAYMIANTDVNANVKREGGLVRLSGGRRGSDEYSSPNLATRTLALDIAQREEKPSKRWQTQVMSETLNVGGGDGCEVETRIQQATSPTAFRTASRMTTDYASPMMPRRSLALPSATRVHEPEPARTTEHRLKPLTESASLAEIREGIRERVRIYQEERRQQESVASPLTPRRTLETSQDTPRAEQMTEELPPEPVASPMQLARGSAAAASQENLLALAKVAAVQPMPPKAPFVMRLDAPGSAKAICIEKQEKVSAMLKAIMKRLDYLKPTALAGCEQLMKKVVDTFEHSLVDSVTPDIYSQRPPTDKMLDAPDGTEETVSTDSASEDNPIKKRRV